MARDAWTDARLDDLNKRVDEGFRETREEFRAVRSEMKSEFQAVRAEMKSEFQSVRAEMKAEFQAVRTEIGEVRSEVSALARAIMQLTWGLIGTMLVGFLGIAATLFVTL
ncbi:MAG TPA: hypothetical protein VFY75_08385 [Solirubrobacterales bacterium]|nr:hypothetical protein [Solirubrobacterales bacterium]